MRHLIFLSFILSLVTLISCTSKTDSRPADETAPSSTLHSGVPFQVDAPRCEVKWTAFKPTGQHHGIVPVSGGTLYVNGNVITSGSVTLNMAALEVHDGEGEMKEKLTNHLRGTTPGKEDDFFNVGKFPTATFTVRGSTPIENDPAWTHTINGELTMKGITKPVSFKANVDLMAGNALKATSEAFVINRAEWNIKFKSKSFFDDLKDDFINDEIRLELTLGAVKS